MIQLPAFDLRLFIFRGMRNLAVWYFCFMSTALSYGQEIITPQGDTVHMLHGRVSGLTGILPMVQVHIINLSLNRATLTDRSGFFQIEAARNDTLYFSHIGFKKKLIRYLPEHRDSSGLLQVIMSEDTVVLKRYRVFAATRIVQFRSDFISREVVKDTLNPAFEAFLEENHFVAPSAGIVLPGPFTLIYENFNKQARLKRKLERNRQEYYDNLSEEEKKKVLFHNDP